MGKTTDIDEILREWFGPGMGRAEVEGDRKARWWKKDEAYDRKLRGRWLARLNEAREGGLDAWTATPEGTLALVILLDQLGRNIHRGSAEMFAGDAKAIGIAVDALDRGDDRRLHPRQSVFLYMPLMHSERLDHQDRCVDLFDALAAGAEDAERKDLEVNADFARRHRAIVARFGRFPHRNALLGRDSSPEELAFLQQPGSSF